MPPTARKQPQDRKPKKADTDHANDTYMRMTIGDQEFVSSRPIRAAMKVCNAGSFGIFGACPERC